MRPSGDPEGLHFGVRFLVEANYLGGESYQGILTKLSHKRAEVRLEKPVPILSNLKNAVRWHPRTRYSWQFVRQGPRRGSGE